MKSTTMISVLSFFIFLSLVSCKKEVEDPEPETPNTGGGGDTTATDGPQITVNSISLEPVSVTFGRTDLPSSMVELNGTLSGVRGSELVYSTNKGIDWTTSTATIQGAFLCRAGDNVFAASPGDRLYKGVNDGQLWSPQIHENLPFSSLYNIITMAGSNDLLALLFHHNGNDLSDKLFISKDQGETFSEATDFGGKSLRIHLGVTENTIWAYRNDSLLKSTDFGTSWEFFDIGISEAYNFKVTDDFVAVQSGSTVKYSTDEGLTWIDQPDRIMPKGHLYNGDMLATGEAPHGEIRAYRSPDIGNTWYDVGICHEQALDIVTTDTDTWIIGPQNIALLTDGDAGWRLLGLPNEQHVDIEFTISTIFVFSSTKYVYVSNDDGETWYPRQFLSVVPSCASIHPNGDVLIAYGGNNTTSPELAVFDPQLLFQRYVKGIQISGYQVAEMVWINDGLLAAGFNKWNDDLKIFATSTQTLTSWTVKTSSFLQRGHFRDLVKSGAVAAALIHGEFNNVPQIATTLGEGVEDKTFWNSTSFKMTPGEAYSFTSPPSNSNAYFTQYFDNQWFIGNNTAHSGTWNSDLFTFETAKKIRFDNDGKLWVLTDGGTFRSEFVVELASE